MDSLAARSWKHFRMFWTLFCLKIKNINLEKLFLWTFFRRRVGAYPEIMRWLSGLRQRRRGAEMLNTIIQRRRDAEYHHSDRKKFVAFWYRNLFQLNQLGRSISNGRCEHHWSTDFRTVMIPHSLEEIVTQTHRLWHGNRMVDGGDLRQTHFVEETLVSFQWMLPVMHLHQLPAGDLTLSLRSFETRLTLHFDCIQPWHNWRNHWHIDSELKTSIWRWATKAARCWSLKSASALTCHLATAVVQLLHFIVDWTW